MPSEPPHRYIDARTGLSVNCDMSRPRVLTCVQWVCESCAFRALATTQVAAEHAAIEHHVYAHDREAA